MNCQQADHAFMLYADKTIKPAAASALAKHVLTCDDCRELFLAFDEALDDISQFDDPAPADFTAHVMKAVRELPPYTQAATRALSDVAIRVFWGLCAVLLGISLIGMNNPDGVNAFINSYPLVYAVAAALASAGEALQAAAQQLLQLGSQTGATVSPWFAASALFFVGIAGAILAVLMRGENLKA
jgi:anti-sigma factor RsiW